MKKPEILTGDCQVFLTWLQVFFVTTRMSNVNECNQALRLIPKVLDFYDHPTELVRGEEPSCRKISYEDHDKERRTKWVEDHRAWQNFQCVFEGKLKVDKKGFIWYEKPSKLGGTYWEHVGKVGDTHEQIISNCKKLEIQLRWNPGHTN